jgi:hypothetical protein
MILKKLISVHYGEMKTMMNDKEIVTLEQVRQFLAGTSDVKLEIEGKDECYRWIEEAFERFGYPRRRKVDKGLLLRFIGRVSGYSRIQVKRFARQFVETEHVKRRQPAKPRGFTKRYTSDDIRLLAKTDELHETLSGQATKKICERAFEIFNQPEYARLARISVSHLYNLRHTKSYRNVRIHFEKTRPKASIIGERRKPHSNGKPGYIRIDTVHQGDSGGSKGVYHINAVDEETQFEIVSSTEKISENFLIPVLESIIGQFPFTVLGFHSDNGSEYINRNVAALLNKLLIELTKSRPRHSNDNALAESKNGSIVRKHLGYTHIPQPYAPLINRFLKDFLNPYLNFHRPCFFPEICLDQNGKLRKRYLYKNMTTPYEKLKSIPNSNSFLKPRINFEILDEIAHKMSDNQSAKLMSNAKDLLFKTINEQEKYAFKKSSS